MAVNLTYGTSGIKPKDYRVFIESYSIAGEAANTYNNTKSKANLQALVGANFQGALLKELGECRADSIDLGIADGDSVEGNVLGKIVLGKAGTFAVELINSTPENIAALEALDGVACTIVLIERDTHGASLKTVVCMNNVVVSHGEKLTGGDSIRETLNVEKSVPSASSFRTITDISFEV